MTSNKIDCKAFKVNILNKVYDINLMVISARSDSIISHNVVDVDFITLLLLYEGIASWLSITIEYPDNLLAVLSGYSMAPLVSESLSMVNRESSGSVLFRITKINCSIDFSNMEFD